MFFYSRWWKWGCSFSSQAEWPTNSGSMWIGWLVVFEWLFHQELQITGTQRHRRVLMILYVAMHICVCVCGLNSYQYNVVINIYIDICIYIYILCVVDLHNDSVKFWTFHLFSESQTSTTPPQFWLCSWSRLERKHDWKSLGEGGGGSRWHLCF